VGLITQTLNFVFLTGLLLEPWGRRLNLTGPISFFGPTSKFGLWLGYILFGQNMPHVALVQLLNHTPRTISGVI
jgi:hypothetical protein